MAALKHPGWIFPDPREEDPEGPIALGADLAPETLMTAYQSGYFPMPIPQIGSLGWWSPDPRGVLMPDGFHMSRSLRRSIKQFEFRVDTAFNDVIFACADPTRPHGWIDDNVVIAYSELHRHGIAHSVEVWRDDQLVGGLYGVNIGSFFAAESKFHRVTDASKAAVAALVDIMKTVPNGLIDVQWATPHLESLGVIEISRNDYLDRLGPACAGPIPTAFQSLQREISAEHFQ